MNTTNQWDLKIVREGVGILMGEFSRYSAY